jgi:hypothetical protein
MNYPITYHSSRITHYASRFRHYLFIPIISYDGTFLPTFSFKKKKLIKRNTKEKEKIEQKKRRK